MSFCPRPCKARTPRNATLAASSLSTPGGSEATITGDEEKNVHLVLDDIVSRLQADIATAQKTHGVAKAAAEKEGKEAQKAKEEMEAENNKLIGALPTFTIAKGPPDRAAERYRVCADKRTNAETLAADDSWRARTRALQAALTQLKILREGFSKVFGNVSTGDIWR